MLSTKDAVIYTFILGLVVFSCRLFPFVFFRKTSAKGSRVLDFIERTSPPVAMTVLAFNALSSPPCAAYATGGLAAALHTALPSLAAASLTALLHLWKRNPLVSIFAGTALYMGITHFI